MHRPAAHLAPHEAGQEVGPGSGAWSVALRAVGVRDPGVDPLPHVSVDDRWPSPQATADRLRHLPIAHVGADERHRADLRTESQRHSSRIDVPVSSSPSAAIRSAPGRAGTRSSARSTARWPSASGSPSSSAWKVASPRSSAPRSPTSCPARPSSGSADSACRDCSTAVTDSSCAVSTHARASSSTASVSPAASSRHSRRC